MTKCPTCKGKGHVFWAPALLNVVGRIFYPFETNDPDGVSRAPCKQCLGRGFIAVDLNQTMGYQRQYGRE